MDAQQEFFTRLKQELEAMGYAVYDGFLPPENTPYPFIYLGDFRQNDIFTKCGAYGKVYPMIHVWHNKPNQRGTVSKMVLDIKRAFVKIDRTENFSWNAQNVTGRILADKTTKTPLLHGVAEAELLFS